MQEPGRERRRVRERMVWIPRVPLSDQAEDVVVGEQFGHDQNKSDNSEGDLHSFSPEAPAGDRLLPPLRRRPFAE